MEDKSFDEHNKNVDKEVNQAYDQIDQIKSNKYHNKNLVQRLLRKVGYLEDQYLI